MARLLYLEASPRHELSVSSRAAGAFLESYRDANPADTIDHYHLFEDDVPVFDEEAARQKMEHIQRLRTEGKGIEPVGKWGAVLAQVERLKAADKILLSSPMWNFSIPYRLKQYIDVVVQPGLTFGVNRKGEYVGLLRDKRMQLILSSGSAYAPRFPLPDDGPKTNFQRCYLEHIARYIGIADVRTIHLDAMDQGTPEDRAARLESRLEELTVAGRDF